MRLIRIASTKSWSMSIRIPITFKNGCWNCCLMVTIALWWEISSNLSIVSVRQIRRFSMRSFNAMRKIQKRASSFSSRKTSVVVQKCCQQPMMFLNVSWTKRSGKSTMITCTSLFLPIPNWLPIQTTRQNFSSTTSMTQVRKKRIRQKRNSLVRCA